MCMWVHACVFVCVSMCVCPCVFACVCIKLLTNHTTSINSKLDDGRSRNDTSKLQYPSAQVLSALSIISTDIIMQTMVP